MLKGLGQKIKMYRNKKNLTQHAFSNAIEISPNYLSALERDVKVPKLETFVRIANELKVTANDLLGENILAEEKEYDVELLNKLLSLPEEEKEKILHVIAVMIDDVQNK